MASASSAPVERKQLPTPYLTSVPDAAGFFGDFGGSFIPPALQAQMDSVCAGYEEIRKTPAFVNELDQIRRNYQGRPTPLQKAARLSEHVGGNTQNGVEIWLKREDLNHTGAHKLNHCVSTVPGTARAHGAVRCATRDA